MSLDAALGELRNIAQWFIYRLEWDGEESKYDKFPCPPDGRAEKIKASDPNNWFTYDQACARIATLPRSGELCYTLGFWLTSTTGYFFFDLDGVANAGVLTPDAAQRSARFTGALMEWSSSGTGMHVIARTLSPPAEHRTRPKKGIDLPYEFYTDGRGIAFGLSGQAVGSADTYHDGAVAELIEQIFTAPTLGEISRPEWRGPSDDDELIRRMLAARESAQAAFGQKASLSVLWRGDAEKDSNHDMALASHLAFWTGCDEERMRRLMWRSGMVRKKWTTHRTYLTLTINKAIAGCSNVYQEPLRNHSAMQAAYASEPQVPAPLSVISAGERISQETFSKMENVLDEISSCGTELELHNNIIPRIQLIGIPPALQERVVSAVKNKLSLWDNRIGVARLRALLFPPAVKREIEGQLPEWAEPYCFVNGEDCFFNTANGTRMSLTGFQATYGRLMPAINGRRDNAAERCLHFWNMPVVEQVAYRPDQGPYFDWDGVSFANSYSPSSVPPVASYTPDGVAGIEAFKAMLFDMCGRREPVFLNLLYWYAYNVQNPGKKIRWAPIIKGVHGDGKTLAISVLRAAMGHRNVGTTGNSTLTNSGGFTDWAVGAAVNVIEEIMLTGKQRYQLYNAMKEFVSNDIVSVNAKGKRTYSAWNCTNHIANTNHNDALPMEATDRRWFVIFTPWASLDAMRTYCALDEAGWKARTDAIDHGKEYCAGEFRAWFLAIEIPQSFDVNGSAMMTPEKKRMMASSTDDAESLAESIIAEGGYGITPNVLSSSQLSRLLAMRSVGLGFEAPKGTALNHMLTRLGFSKLENYVKWDGQTHTIWVKNGIELTKDQIRLELCKSQPQF